MIETDAESHIIVLCDGKIGVGPLTYNCTSRLQTRERYWGQAKETMRSNGWRTRKVRIPHPGWPTEERWLHVCPNCSVFDPRHKAPAKAEEPKLGL